VTDSSVATSFRMPSSRFDSHPAEITAPTGITDEMVAGQAIDPVEVGAFASGAALVIVHNAAFDRRLVERQRGVTTKPWACSMTQID
jgi:DNA polymerase-3 subunit epsilon